MQRSRKILIGAGGAVVLLAVAAAIAGPTIYRDVFAAPPAPLPSLGGDERMTDGATPAGEPLDPAKLVGGWSVAQGSEAGYRVNEVLNGTDVTVTGRTEDVSGSFTIEGIGLTLQSATLTVDVASITTDSAQRDSYFRNQALRVSDHPTATFTLTEPVVLDAAPKSGSVLTAEAGGELTIAGETQPVTASVEVRSDGTTAEIAGSIPITFEDFGVEAPNLGFVSVEDAGFVEFQITASR